jgi:PEP-CTERM motif
VRKYTSFALAGALALIIQTNSQAQVTITGWTFETNAVAVNNNPSPTTGSGTASSLGMDVYPTPNVGVTTDDVLLGKNSDTGANGVADTTLTWRIRGQAGANGAANGWSSLAPIGTQGAQFAASTVGFSNLTVKLDWYATTQGEANMQLQYTVNGTTWNNVQLTLGGSDAGLVVSNNTTSANTVNGWFVSDNILNPGATGAGQDWFTGLTATISDPLAANDPNFAIRMVNASTGADDVSTQGTALNNNSGNWRFDNVTISGVAVVPEPSTVAMVGMGILGMLSLRRRR